MPPDAIELISRWEDSGAAERANYQMFLSELCDIHRRPPPRPHLARSREKPLRLRPRHHPHQPGRLHRHQLHRSLQGPPLRLRNQTGPLRRRQTADELAKPAATKIRPRQARHRSPSTRPSNAPTTRPAATSPRCPPTRAARPSSSSATSATAIDLYAEFTCTGGHYERFPDPESHRIHPRRTCTARKSATASATSGSIPIRSIPRRHAAEVTRDIAGRLALLAKSLEADGHDPQVIAGFLQRCLFTMFAEDIGLLPEDGFKTLLERVKDNPARLPGAHLRPVEGNGHRHRITPPCCSRKSPASTAASSKTPPPSRSPPRSSPCSPMPPPPIGRAVEPSIFGTLLDPRARSPRAPQTRRGIHPALLRRAPRSAPPSSSPLRDEWDAVRIAAATLHQRGRPAEDPRRPNSKPTPRRNLGHRRRRQGETTRSRRRQTPRARPNKKDAEALKLVIAFHRHLCGLTVLDPACGTAQLPLRHPRTHEAPRSRGARTHRPPSVATPRLEMQGFHSPPRAIPRPRTQPAAPSPSPSSSSGSATSNGSAKPPARPTPATARCSRKTQTIFEQDAVLAYDERIPRRDPDTGEILTIWDGHTTKPHPVTGKEVPDESATHRPLRLHQPPPRRMAAGGLHRRQSAVHRSLPHARRPRRRLHRSPAQSMERRRSRVRRLRHVLVAQGRCSKSRKARCKRFGFITTNSIHQTFNRRVIEPFLADAKKPLHLAYAIPDHPWIDSADGAAVRIAMTVAAPGNAEGILEKVITEQAREDGENEVTLLRSGGILAANLQIGADLTSCSWAQSKLENRFTQESNLFGAGFDLTPEEANELSQFGCLTPTSPYRPYRNGSDLTDKSTRSYRSIDFFGLTRSSKLRSAPAFYQHIYSSR